MPLLKVLINFGKKEYLEDMIVLHLQFLEESVNAFCSITIMKNHIEVLLKRNNGTRFPGILRDRFWKSLRHLPKSFTLERYIDSNGNLNLPIAKGKVSFIRKVDSHGRIDVNGAAYFIRKKLERQYVVATIFTHRKRLVVKQDNRIIKSFSFPIEGHIVAPLLPITKRKT